jgi:archaemetzincin
VKAFFKKYLTSRLHVLLFILILLIPINLIVRKYVVTYTYHGSELSSYPITNINKGRNYKKPELLFVPLGNIDSDLLSQIAETTASAFNLPYKIAERLPLPDYAVIQGSNQYNIDALLSSIAFMKAADNIHTLAITNVDVTANGYRFLFAKNVRPQHYSVMSVYRLISQAPVAGIVDPMLEERSEKMAIHQIAHTFGYEDCQTRNCVMMYSDSVDELDCKSTDFCPKCKEIFSFRIQ